MLLFLRSMFKKGLKTSLIFFFVLQSFTFFAGEFQEATKAYQEKNWSQAANLFETYLSKHPNEANTYYNLGVCEMKQEKFVDAIWNFEKAYKLSPQLSEAQNQLNACYKKLNFIESWSPPIGVFKAKLFKFSDKQLAFTLILLSFVSGTLLFLHFKRKSNKRLTRFSFALSLIFTFLTALILIQKKSFTEGINHAIVWTPISSVYLSEKGNALKELSLKAGERVNLGKISPNRIELELTNKEHVWVERSQVKLIQ